MDLQKAIWGVKSYFGKEYFSIHDTAYISEEAEKNLQRHSACPPFEHCLIDQGGGGITGDDFHGTAFFHIAERQYLVVEY